MNPKSNSLASRPNAPSTNEILADVQNAADNDIIFSLFKNSESTQRSELNSPDSASVSPDESQASTSQQQQSRSSTPASVNNCGDNHDTIDPSTETVNKDDIERTYDQALQFLDVSDQLKSAPDLLQAKYDVLNKLGHELGDLIGDLKRQSSEILQQSASNVTKNQTGGKKRTSKKGNKK